MRHLIINAWLACVAIMAVGCGGDGSHAQTDADSAQPVRKAIYTGKYSPDSTFIVISKKDLMLTVYAAVGGDTLPLANYRVCLSRNKGQKQGDGDMKTPESEPGQPFTITQIVDADTWCHDFGDGRGSIKAYGHWFMRLATPFKGIGIHGCTGNEWSIPDSKLPVPEGKTRGRDSEGCIRLNDADIIALHDKYARVGMPVVVKQEGQGLLPYEIAR